MHGYMGAECRDLCAVWMCTRGRTGPGCRCHVAPPQLYCMMHMRLWPIFSGVHVFNRVWKRWHTVQCSFQTTDGTMASAKQMNAEVAKLK